MIELLIAILMAMTTNSACDLGVETDWYTWANNHQQAYSLHEFEYPDDVAIDDTWLMYDEASGEYVLLVFKDDVSDTIAANRYAFPHCRCARIVTP